MVRRKKNVAGIYHVESILGKRRRGGVRSNHKAIKYDYLVKWFGYNLKDATWEPQENLNSFLLEDFEKDLSFRLKNPGKKSKFNNYRKELTLKYNKKKKR